TDNILLEKVYPVKAKEYLSESGSKLGRIVSSNSILVTCIAGSKKSIGNCCLTDRTVAFNQQINAFKNFDKFYNQTFLYRLFKEYQSYIQNSATDGMKKRSEERRVGKERRGGGALSVDKGQLLGQR